MNVDALIVAFDRGLRTVFAPASSVRPVPGTTLPEGVLSPDERRHVAGLMRVNHVGEVCAQALYQAQSSFARQPVLRRELLSAAAEETEHLAWTSQRLREMGGRRSLLNPFWYAGAWMIGASAAWVGDRWSLGFLAETERQVVAHLSGHLQRLPAQDDKSRAIVLQMRTDEAAHAETAVAAGAAPLPWPLRIAMRGAARVMTGTAYFI